MPTVENDYDEEYLSFEDRLEGAINSYVKGLSLNQLKDYVVTDLSDYYANADSDSVWSFIEEREKVERIIHDCSSLLKPLVCLEGLVSALCHWQSMFRDGNLSEDFGKEIAEILLKAAKDIKEKIMRMIPPDTYRTWASMFREGGLYDEYAEELADLLDFLADNAEFNLAMEKAKSEWTNERLH